MPSGGDEDGVPRGEQGDLSRLSRDFDEIADVEGIAGAEEDAGEIVFQDVLEGEAKRDPDETGRPEHGADDRGRIEDLEGDDDAEGHDREPDETTCEVSSERGNPQAGVPTFATMEKVREDRKKGDHTQGDGNERQFGHEAAPEAVELLHGRGQAGAHLRRFGQAVEGQDDALGAIHEGQGFLARFCSRHLAGESHHPGVHLHVDLLELPDL